MQTQKQRHEIPYTEIEPKPRKHNTWIAKPLHLEQCKNTYPTRQNVQENLS